MSSGKARLGVAGDPIRVHLFFRPFRSGATYSIERAFDTMIPALPRDRYIVRRFVCPYANKGVIRRLLLMIWAATRQGDVNHVTGDVHFLVLLMRRRRTIVTIHDTGSARRLRGLRGLLFRLFWLDLPARRAAAITVISEFSRSEVERFAPVAAGKIRVVPNCLTVDVAGVRQGFNEAAPRILIVGTTPNKNLPTAIEALRHLPCRLTTIGPLTAEYTQLLAGAGLAHENHVDLTEADIEEQYRKADMLLFTSTYEGFGLPIIEAQALGCLVVASDLEPMRSVAGRGALLVDPFDASAIRSAIERLRDDPALRARLRDDGLRNVERYTAAAVAGQYAALYDEIASGLRQ